MELEWIWDGFGNGSGWSRNGFRDGPRRGSGWRWEWIWDGSRNGFGWIWNGLRSGSEGSLPRVSHDNRSAPSDHADKREEFHEGKAPLLVSGIEVTKSTRR